MRVDGTEKVGEAGRRPPDTRRAGCDSAYAGGEDDQGRSSGQRSRWCEDPVEAGRGGGVGNGLGSGVVVAIEIPGLEPEGDTDGVVDEIQDRQVPDRDFPDPALYLEGVDAGVGEVAEQFRPAGLLLVRGVPRPRATGAVVAAVGDRRISK